MAAEMAEFVGKNSRKGSGYRKDALEICAGNHGSKAIDTHGFKALKKQMTRLHKAQQETNTGKL